MSSRSESSSSRARVCFEICQLNHRIMPDLFVPHIVYWRPFHLRRSPSLFPKKVLKGCYFMAVKSIPRKVFGSSRAPVKLTGKNDVIFSVPNFSCALRNTRKLFRGLNGTVFGSFEKRTPVESSFPGAFSALLDSFHLLCFAPTYCLRVYKDTQTCTSSL